MLRDSTPAVLTARWTHGLLVALFAGAALLFRYAARGPAAGQPT